MKTKIGVLGIGGVGGYFGGLLALKYKGDSFVDIIFITKPETESIIREKGLRLITPEKEQVVFPDIVCSNTDSIEMVDILIVAVKSYDLVESIINFRTVIKDDTIILPLLNGVAAKDKIQKKFPNNLVLDGCVFVISKILERGIIEQIGKKGVLYFGSDKNDIRLEKLYEIFLDAEINTKYSSNIIEVVWRKFMFISSLASLTSYLEVTSGQIFEIQKYKNLLIELLNEFNNVAKANNINLSESTIENTITKMEALPYETTTSMQRDFQQNKKTEYRYLTKYIVDLGEELKVSVPIFELVLTEFEKREK